MTTSIVDLPTEIIEKIFSFIPLITLSRHVVSVCQKWSDIVKQERYSKVISLNESQLKNDPTCMLQKFSKTIRALQLINFLDNPSMISRAFFSEWDSLIKLHLDHLNIPLDSVNIITSRCLNLMCLKISSVTVIGESVPPEILFGPNQIKHLNIENDKSYIYPYRGGCKQLNEMKNVDFLSISILGIERTCPHLEYLNLISDHVSPHSFQSFMRGFVEKIKHLQMDASLMNSECIKLISKSSKLESLTLIYISKEASQSIVNIFDNVTLKYLNLRFDCLIDLKDMLQTINFNIEHLSLTGGYRLNISGDVETISAIVQSFPNLTSLNLLNWKTNDEAVALLSQCPKLEILVLNDTDITGTCFHSLMKLQNLKNLYVYNCQKLKTNLALAYKNATGITLHEYEDLCTTDEDYKTINPFEDGVNCGCFKGLFLSK